MKNRLMITLLGVVFLSAAVPAFGGTEEDPEVLIGRVRAVLGNPHPQHEDFTKALVAALDAALLILPEADYGEEFRARIGTVRKMFEEQHLFSDKIRQYLGFAYRMVSGGKPWQVPEVLKTLEPKKGIEKSLEICTGLIDEALAEWKAGRNEQAVARLISFVILVVTPIEA